MAEAAFRAGNFDEVRRLCDQVLGIDPRSVSALALKGIALVRQDRPSEALELLRTANSLAPQAFEVWLWLGISQRLTGDPAGSVKSLARAGQLVPQNGAVWQQMGVSYLDARNPVKAVESLRRAAQLGRDDAENNHQLAIAFQLLGDGQQVLHHLRRATSLDPERFESWVTRGNACLEQALRDEAVECFGSAHALEPASARGHIQLARKLREQGDLDGARAALQASIELEPDSPDAHELASNLLQQLGRFDEAGASLDRAISLAPERGRLWFSRTVCRRATEEDRENMAQMEAMLKRPGVSIDDQRNLHYGLAKWYADLKEDRDAIKHYEAANKVMRQMQGRDKFDRKVHTREIDLKISTFTPEFFEADTTPSSDSDRPILIVGMIRSGTTLVEQILSCHPLVAAGGELGFWLERSRGGIGPMIDRSGKALSNMKETAQEYLQLLEGLGDGQPRTTDKMPHNYLYLGNVHMAFPRAKFVFCRRNPIDNCFSIYTTPYRAPLDFAHDKGKIAFCYREHLRLMDHWKAVLPEDVLLEVSYEELVANPEEGTRRLIEFCGLPWDEACLSPHANSRAVKTPSLWQVRQPVYTTSVEKWRRFEPWLGEFLSL